MALRNRLSELKGKLKETLAEAENRALARIAPEAPHAAGEEDPPVVARLMVEIRSDGSRTIARGAVEDLASGERAAIEARGATPVQLAASLAKTLMATPLLARATIKAVLDARRDAGDKRGK